jgi:hypothetical protein
MMNDAPNPRWTITKAEWDSMSADGRMWRRAVWIFPALYAALGVMLVLLSIRSPSVPGVDLLLTIKRVMAGVGVGALVLSFIMHILTRRRRNRWRELHPRIWELDGLACPWCHETIDDAPCRGHGFTREEHALLLVRWESAALNDIARKMTSEAELLKRRRKGSGLSRVAAIASAPWRSYWAVINDGDATPSERLRRIAPMVAICATAAIALAIACAVYWDRSMALLTAWFAACIPLIATAAALAGPAWRAGRLRCTKCGHLCADDQVKRCSECGADLTQPASVTRKERSGYSSFVLPLLPALLVVGGPWLAGTLVGVLPRGVQVAIYSWTKPPADYFRNLNPRTMTQAEIDDAVDVLISCAGPRGPRPLRDENFLGTAIATGKVPAATIERAARAIVQAELGLHRDGDAIVATVTPSFGELILGDDATPRLVFGGVSVDGGPWTKGADWSLFMHDIDRFWRQNGQLRTLPESKLAFTARLEGTSPGKRTVRARCWIVVWGPSWERYTPEFDESGALIPPADALGVYPLELKATVDLR